MPCKVMKNVYVQKCRMLNTFKCVLEKKKKLNIKMKRIPTQGA